MLVNTVVAEYLFDFVVATWSERKKDTISFFSTFISRCKPDCKPDYNPDSLLFAFNIAFLSSAVSIFSAKKKKKVLDLPALFLNQQWLHLNAMSF